MVQHENLRQCGQTAPPPCASQRSRHIELPKPRHPPIMLDDNAPDLSTAMYTFSLKVESITTSRNQPNTTRNRAQGLTRQLGQTEPFQFGWSILNSAIRRARYRRSGSC